MLHGRSGEGCAKQDPVRAMFSLARARKAAFPLARSTKVVFPVALRRRILAVVRTHMHRTREDAEVTTAREARTMNDRPAEAHTRGREEADAGSTRRRTSE